MRDEIEGADFPGVRAFRGGPACAHAGLEQEPACADCDPCQYERGQKGWVGRPFRPGDEDERAAIDDAGDVMRDPACGILEAETCGLSDILVKHLAARHMEKPASDRGPIGLGLFEDAMEDDGPEVHGGGAANADDERAEEKIGQNLRHGLDPVVSAFMPQNE